MKNQYLPSVTGHKTTLTVPQTVHASTAVHTAQRTTRNPYDSLDLSSYLISREGKQRLSMTIEHQTQTARPSNRKQKSVVQRSLQPVSHRQEPELMQNSLFDYNQTDVDRLDESFFQRSEAKSNPNNRYGTTNKIKKGYQAADQNNINLVDDDDLVNYAQFTTTKFNFIKPDRTNKQHLSLGRSLGEWSCDIKDSLCKQIDQSKLKKAGNLKKTNESVMEDSMIQFETEQREIISTLQKTSLDSSLALSSAACSVKANISNMFRSKQKAQLDQFLTQRIEQKCKEKIELQSKLQHLASVRKCYKGQDQESIRHSLLKSINDWKGPTDLNQGGKKLINYYKMREQRKNEQSQCSGDKSNSPRKKIRDPPPPKNTFERRQIQKQAKKLEERLYLNDPEQLWLRFHTGIPTPRSVKFEPKTNVFKPKAEITDSGYKQTKYMDIGEIGELYARREHDHKLFLKKQEEDHYKAATAKIHLPWSSERVALKLTRNVKPQTVEFLMAREKGFKEQEEINTQVFSHKVDQFVNQIATGTNLHCLQNEPPQTQRFTNLQSLVHCSPLNSPVIEPASPKSDDSLHTLKLREKISRTGNRKVQLTKLDQQIKVADEPADLEKMGQKILDEFEFQQMCKDSASKGENKNESTNLRYFLEANKLGEPTLNLLAMITQDKELSLQEQKITIGVANGFLEASKTNNEMVQKLIINNCNFAEGALEILMKGMILQKKMAKLVVQRTELGEAVIDSVIEMLEKYSPCAISEFRVEKCAIGQQNLAQILMILKSVDLVRKFGLVGMELGVQHLQIMEKWLPETSQLKSLDLNNCKVKTGNYLTLLKAIAQNKSLQNVNMGWNKLMKNSQFAAVGFEPNTEQEQQRASSSMLRQSSQLSHQEKAPSPKKQSKKPAPEKTHGQTVLESIVQICQNDRMQHLDFTECGLTSEILLKLIRPIRKSKSLLAIHLTGNPGLSFEVEKKILEKLSVIQSTQQPFQSFQHGLNRLSIDKDIRQNINSPIKQQKLVMESIALKKILQKKAETLTFDNTIQQNVQQRHFILTRQLGHQLEIPASQKWHLYRNHGSECYICDLKVYSVFFWSPEIGQIEADDIGLSPSDKHKLLCRVFAQEKLDAQQLKETLTLEPVLFRKEKKRVWNEELGQFEDVLPPSTPKQEVNNIEQGQQDVNQDFSNNRPEYTQKDDGILELNNMPSLFKQFKEPMLYGSFNNWRPQPLIPIHRVSLALNNEPLPEPLELLKNQKKIRRDVEGVNEMSAMERRFYSIFIENWRVRHHRDEVWSAALRKLICYKSPHLTSAQLLRHIDSSGLYFGANFISAGKQDYIVQHGNKFYFHQTLADFRKEEIVVQNLSFAEKEQIERNPNVFANWQAETTTIIDQMANQDFQYWKIEKFVKESQEVVEVQKIIRQHYMFLKQVFTVFASKGSFPTLCQLESGNLFQECNLFSKDFTQGICDTQFIASRVDADNRGFKIYNQAKLDCNRHEFLECVVRVALNKYKMTGQAKDIPSALKLLIEQMRLTFGKMVTAQSFRDEQLWTREVNLTLDANLPELKKLYDTCKGPSNIRLSLQQAVDLFANVDTKVRIADNDAMFCYAQSLQPVVDIVKWGKSQLWHIDFIEFLEMFGRVAQIAVAGNEMLHEKINVLMDEYLPMIGCQRQMPEYYETVGGEDSIGDESY